MSFKLLNQNILNEMRYLREHGELIPVKFGFKTWNEFDKGRFIMGSRRCTVLIGGEPNHGKSMVTYELVMQLMEKHDFKIALFASETGKIANIFTHFCSLYIGQPYYKVRADGSENKYAMSDDECLIAEEFIRNHLYVFELSMTDSNYQTLDNIYKQVADLERDMDFKIDSVVIDPVYDVDDFEPKADEVLRILNRFNMEAQANDRFDIMVNHVAETHKHTDLKTGLRKKFPAMADEFYGGKNNNRKAMLQILVHRPAPNDDPEKGPIIKENQTNIHILKIKPEGVAKWGIYDIYYDWKSRRFYEYYIENERPVFAFADCTRFYSRNPVSNIDTTKLRFTTEQAFLGERAIIQPSNENLDDDDEFPF